MGVQKLLKPQKILTHTLSPLLIGTALPALLVTSCRSTSNTEAAVQAVPVQIETLQPGTVENSSEFVGSLEAVQLAEVRSEIQGRIERILVEPGQSVEAGQAIMVLKPDQTVPQYEGALAAVDVARGSREQALKALDIAKAQRDTAQATLELDTVNVSRAQLLVEEGALGQIRLDEAFRQQEASRNALIAAEEQVSAAQVAIQQADASIRQAQAQADASLVSVQFKQITAPIAGIIDNSTLKVGDYVSVGEPIARVAQTEALFLNIEVPSNRSRQLRTGLMVELMDPIERERLAVGSITFVSPTIDPSAQAILTKARFRNDDSSLRDGQNVAARIIWDSQPGLLIPTTAVKVIGGKDFVFLVEDQTEDTGQMVARLTPVELGDIQANSYQVISGLEAGDRLAVSNILKLQDETSVQPEAGGVN